MQSASRPDRARPVGRGAKVRAAVLSAALEELSAAGYAALTVENVARRAGVHKTTIYRRWKDRDTLVVDALGDRIAMDIPVPDTQALATDLRELARSLVGWLTSPEGRAVVATMLSDAVRVPEIADARRAVFDDRIRRAEPVVTRAIDRGELPVGTDPGEIVKDLAAPIYFRMLITGEPIDETTADHAAQVALAAALARGQGSADHRQ
ncbi:TetR/AcrR family transcriptional regulator [Streptomyces sp. 8N706]|uniref:TetR/AcrR family transcriptional regulator n=1 Tax=Streptomyces sp. 8N706 TaxID=3457416 RepID=UPI003FD69526